MAISWRVSLSLACSHSLRNASILSSFGQPNQALSPLAGSGGLSHGLSISAPSKSVPKTFQPPSPTGFFDARRVTTVPQSLVTSSALRPSFLTSCSATSAWIWFVNIRRHQPAPSAGEITPPGVPIVRLPALDHAMIVMGRHVEMHEVYSSVCSFRGEREDQGRIRITVVKFGRAPGLDHEPLRDDLEHRTGERAIEGSEW